MAELGFPNLYCFGQALYARAHIIGSSNPHCM